MRGRAADIGDFPVQMGRRAPAMRGRRSHVLRRNEIGFANGGKMPELRSVRISLRRTEWFVDRVRYRVVSFPRQ
jgi:hypothetical protein